MMLVFVGRMFSSFVVVDVLYLVSGVVVLICTYFGQRAVDSIVNLRRVGGLSYSSLSVCLCVFPCVRVSVLSLAYLVI